MARIAHRGGGHGSDFSGGTLVAGGPIQTIKRGLMVALLLAWQFATANPVANAAESKSIGNPFAGLSTTNQRKQVISSLPLNRLTQPARNRILAIAKSPTIYRRLPTQTIECERELFLFMTRNPDTFVGMWDLMGITRVRTQRLGPYQLEAEDGAGTQCKVDLVYGDSNLHIFVADGSYDGKMVAKPIRGQGVFVLRSHYSTSPTGQPIVKGMIDCFVQFDSLGADLVARTLSGVIGRSADNNFVETARFMEQVSMAARKNPPAMLDVARRLPQVGEVTKKQFAEVITTVSRRSGNLTSTPHPTLHPSLQPAPTQPRTVSRESTARRMTRRTQ